MFIGGLVRWLIDRFGPHAAGRKPSEPESEMSPGVLMSTGYIAGGAIAGVLVTFLCFSDTIPDALSTWQYRHYAISQAMPSDRAFREAAEYELGTVPAREPKQVEKLAAQIEDLNKRGSPRTRALPRELPAGTELKVPQRQWPALATFALLVICRWRWAWAVAEAQREERRWLIVGCVLARTISLPTRTE